ncbi:SOUL family heme-binding protein [Microbacterium sp. NPDC091313]
MTEQQPYDVVRQEDGWELRRYPAHVVAETTVSDATFEKAGNRAFRALAGYISGENTARQKIAMTAPVVQQQSQRIAMTAPVVQAAAPGGFVVAFVLPAALTEDDAPVPTDPEVRIRTVPERLVAATRFSGRWTEQSWQEHRDELFAHLRAAGVSPAGEPRFARFNPPFTLPFLRRNEVLVDVDV